MNAYLAFFGLPGGTEIIVIGIIALLLFGSRLPKVAKSMGKSIVEFKKGIKGVQDEIEETMENENCSICSNELNEWRMTISISRYSLNELNE